MSLNVNEYITAHKDFDLTVYGLDFDTVAWAGLVGILTVAISQGFTTEQTQDLINKNTARKIESLAEHKAEKIASLINT